MLRFDRGDSGSGTDSDSNSGVGFLRPLLSLFRGLSATRSGELRVSTVLGPASLRLRFFSLLAAFLCFHSSTRSGVT